MPNDLLAGTAQVAVDGANHMVEGDIKWSASSVKRTPMMGPDGFHGWKEEPIPGTIKISLRDWGGLTVADFNAMRNVTVTLTLASGKIIVGRNMGTVESQEVDAGEAKFDASFAGPQVTEQTVSAA